MNRVQLSALTPYRSYGVITYDIIAGHENVYVNYSGQNVVRVMREVSLCWACHDAMVDM